MKCKFAIAGVLSVSQSAFSQTDDAYDGFFSGSQSEAASGRVSETDDTYDYVLDIPGDAIVCKGKLDAELCSPAFGDCTYFPEYCACEEAQEACKNEMEMITQEDFGSLTYDSESDAVVCPGKQDFEYCSVSGGDCEWSPEYCTCVEECSVSKVAK